MKPFSTTDSALTNDQAVHTLPVYGDDESFEELKTRFAILNRNLETKEILKRRKISDRDWNQTHSL